ncbi:MAG: ABC transporter ATP-binding protein [Calditrichaeota bacterium]|nr:ABC transporter ATP-binding protein [Calditrichota bacterium]
MWKIIGTGLTQAFNQRIIFKELSFEIESGESLVLIGPNGSGKTTLIRIVCNLLRPIEGKIEFFYGDQKKLASQLYSAIGLVGPYLQLYNNLTAFENYVFFRKIRGLNVDYDDFKMLMKKFGLTGREFDELRTYSSGMLQRMKYVCALLHRPPVLILDEPVSNLDESGERIIYDVMEEQRRNKILIFATNNPEEIKFGDKKIRLSV